MNRELVGAIVGIVMGCAPASAATSLQPLSDASIERLLTGYLATWSSNDKFDPTTMSRFYADRVLYYGKPMTRAQVLNDKRRYIQTWPERRYALVPGSHTVSCDAGRTVCAVTGTMEWDRRSTAGERSVGRARLRLLVSAASGGRISKESATILGR